MIRLSTISSLEPYLEPGALILDFGCGSGRDSKYFLSKGYKVEACDGSEEMVRIASETAGIPVRRMLFEELSEVERYDGIFACASILHVPYAGLSDILARVERALKTGGILYVSFKYGTFEGERNGRYFTDMTMERLEECLKACGGENAGSKLEIVESRITGDVRPGRGDEKWLNVILRKRWTEGRGPDTILTQNGDRRPGLLSPSVHFDNFILRT